MIRKARREDLERVEEIYDYARGYMARTGNPTQWADGYPTRELLEEDVAEGRLYLVCDSGGQAHGVFAFCQGEEPCYAVIREGAWPNDLPYATIHRIAGDGTVKGLLKTCLDFCLERHPVIRADTHPNNKIMQHLLEKNGFERCGYIFLEKEDGDGLRIAYQYTGEKTRED